MKIIEFRGGLGNQLFEYAHYIYLKKLFPNQRFFGFYPSRELWMHQGLEIDKRFDVELPSSNSFINAIAWMLFSIKRKIWRGMFLFISTDSCVRENALLQEGYWQDKKYFSIDFRFEYKMPQVINEQTKNLICRLHQVHNTVSVHIRRGDYLTCDNPESFAGICTPSYYNKAINFIKSKINDPQFFFFSDDPEFVCQSFHEENMLVVDWNKGADSYLDMYLMSQCKAMILANSTFSFWAAQNNKNNPIVCCPTRWNNEKVQPDLKMPGWIEIASE